MRQVCALLAALLIAASVHSDVAAQSPAVPKISDKGIKSLVAKHRGKVVLVNFWATWCPPCLEEFPDLVKIYNDYRSKGLEVIAVSMNDHAEPSEMKSLHAFIEKTKPSFPIYIADPINDAFYTSIDKRWETEMPLTVIYDTKGQLRYFHNEARSYAQFEEDLKSLLGSGR